MTFGIHVAIVHVAIEFVQRVVGVPPVQFRRLPRFGKHFWRFDNGIDLQRVLILQVHAFDDVDAVAAGEPWTELVLKPRKKMGDIQAVQLKVDAKYLIRELITETETGNKTKITLQNQVLGAKLPPALFEFKPPADTEVLQN